MLERTGYRRELESSNDPQDLARLDNLNELVSVAHEFSIDRANARALAAEEDEPADEDVPRPDPRRVPERVSLVADTDEIPRARFRRRHADDPAHRQRPGIPVVS